jgi:hypothetical protein
MNLIPSAPTSNTIPFVFMGWDVPTEGKKGWFTLSTGSTHAEARWSLHTMVGGLAMGYAVLQKSLQGCGRAELSQLPCAGDW